MRSLTVLAGPNGAGKSYFSSFFIEKGWITCQPVNIDALENFVDISRIPHDPMRYLKCLKEQVNKIFNELCDDAINNNRDFSYECNLRMDQLYCINKFDKAGYKINLIYLYIDSIELSKNRVKIRINEGGHVVGDESIIENFRQGLKNLDDSVAESNWDHVYLVDNSKDLKSKGDVLTLLLEMKNNNIIQISETLFSENIQKHLPRTTKLIKTFLEKL